MDGPTKPPIRSLEWRAALTMFAYLVAYYLYHRRFRLPAHSQVHRASGSVIERESMTGKKAESDFLQRLLLSTLIWLGTSYREIISMGNLSYYRCQTTPEQVGRCFVQRSEEFHQLYSVYCMNKPRSEALRAQCANDDAFFKVGIHNQYSFYIYTSR